MQNIEYDVAKLNGLFPLGIFLFRSSGRPHFMQANLCRRTEAKRKRCISSVRSHIIILHRFEKELITNKGL